MSTDVSERQKDQQEKHDVAPPPGRPATELSESEYLAQQANNAKLALQQALSDFGSKLGAGLDPHLLTKQHPWITLGAAAVAGFAATAILVPSKEQQALKKLAAIERALNPPPPPPPPAAHDERAAAAGYKTGQHSLMRTLMGEVIGAVRPALISLLTAGVTASAARPSHEEMRAVASAEANNPGGASPPDGGSSQG